MQAVGEENLEGFFLAKKKWNVAAMESGVPYTIISQGAFAQWTFSTLNPVVVKKVAIFIQSFIYVLFAVIFVLHPPPPISAYVESRNVVFSFSTKREHTHRQYWV